MEVGGVVRGVGGRARARRSQNAETNADAEFAERRKRVENLVLAKRARFDERTVDVGRLDRGGEAGRNRRVDASLKRRANLAVGGACAGVGLFA